MLKAEPTPRNRRRRRGWISIAALFAALLLAGRAMLPATVGEQIRRSMLTKLSEHYPHLTFRIEAGHYDPEHGIRLTGIEVRDPKLADDAAPLLVVDQIYVAARIDLDALGEGRLPFQTERVRVVGVTANAWETPDGNWSLESLWPPPQLGPGCPRVDLERVRLRLCRNTDALGPALELSPLEIQLRQPPHETEKQFVVRGSGGIAESLWIKGVLDGERRVQMRGKLTRVSIDDRFYRRLPRSLAPWADKLKKLAIDADVEWQIDGPPEQWQQRWAARVKIHTGRLEDPALPAPLENMQGSFVASPAGVTIEPSQFKLNGSDCQLKGRLDGLQWPCAVRLDVSAQQLELTSGLLRILPGRAATLEEKLHPRGKVDLVGQVHFDGARWHSDTEAWCHNVSVNIDKFPYPVEQLNGRIRYQNQNATATDLTCRAGSAELECSFQIAPKDSNAAHWIDIRGREGMLTLDETLLAALTPRGEPTSKLETFARSLAPGGNLRVIRAHLGRDANGMPTKFFDLEVVDGRLRYEKFPYSLYEVKGRLLVENQSVRLLQFQAQNNGGAHIQCEGNWFALPQQDAGQLDLTFTGFSIPLDDGLRTALPVGARQTWDTLQPDGVLQRLDVRVQLGPQSTVPELTVTAEQWSQPATDRLAGGDAQSTPRRGLSFAPQALPYRLQIARGVVRMQGDEITISDIDGYHGTSRVSAEGRCRKRADGRWQLDIELLTGSRLRPDNELISALPEEIRGGFSKLQLREPVSLRGNTQLILPNLQYPHTTFSWDVLLQLEGNRIGDAGPVHDIRGEIDVRGSSGESGTAAEGVVRIDSLHMNDLQVTGISGPFSIVGSKLVLGKPKPANSPTNPINSANSPARPTNLSPIRGHIFGGQIDLTGEVALTTGQFDVNLQLAGAEVPRLLTELRQSHAGLSGKFGGSAQLEGILGAGNLLRGTGVATLSEAKLYQLPLIVQLFNQLSLTPAEDAAFTDGTARFTLDGDLLTLDDLKLWGDLVVLHGSGTVNSRRELDLAFNTRVSPQSVWSRMVTPLRSQKYTLWTIYVRGPLGDPRIERRALDAVGETLERLFPVMETETATTAPNPNAPSGNGLLNR